jgi:hypothetical protein
MEDQDVHHEFPAHDLVVLARAPFGQWREPASA